MKGNQLKDNLPFVIKYPTFESTRLIDQNGEFIHQIRVKDAQQAAMNAGMDLVCFNRPEQNQLALCKIVDFNKWKYQEEKKKKKLAQENRKETKEIRFSPEIADNDIDHKLKQVFEFLDRGDDVVLTMQIRGRQKAHPELPKDKMTQIIGKCTGHGKLMMRKDTDGLIIVRLSKNG
jgi:translation initiation factor IF-3